MGYNYEWCCIGGKRYMEFEITKKQKKGLKRGE